MFNSSLKTSLKNLICYFPKLVIVSLGELYNSALDKEISRGYLTCSTTFL